MREERGIILYKGQYGSTQQYAQWLAEDTGLSLLDVDFVREDDLEDVEYVILGSSVKLGRISIAKWVRKNWDWIRDKRILLFLVCGTAANLEEQKKVLRSNFPVELLRSFECFSLPGKLDIKRLNLLDRILVFLGSKVAPDDATRHILQEGFDDVNHEHMRYLLDAVDNLDEPAQKHLGIG